MTHHQDDSDAAWWTDEEEEDVPTTKPAQRAPQQSRFREHLSWTAHPDDAVLNAQSGTISLAQDTIPICLTPPHSQAAPSSTGHQMDVPEDADDQEDHGVHTATPSGNHRRPHPPHLILAHTTAPSPLQNLLALPSYTPMTPRGHRLAESGANSPRLAERNAALEMLPDQQHWSSGDEKLKVQDRNMDEPLSATLRRLGAKRKTEVFGDLESEDGVAAIPWRSSALGAIHQEPSHEHQSGRYPSATSTRPRKPDGWGGLRPPSDWFSHYSFGPLRSPNSNVPPPSMDLGLPMLSPKHKHKLGKKKRRAFLLGAMKRQVDEPVYATETEQGKNTWTDEVALPQLGYGSRAMSEPLQDDKEAARLKRKELRKVRFTSLLPTHRGEQKSANIDQVNPFSDHQAEKAFTEYHRASYPPSVHQRTFEDQPCPSVWSSSTYSVKTLWTDHRKIVITVSLLLLTALVLAFLISTSVLSRQLDVVKVELEGQVHQVAVLSQALQKAANAASQATQGLVGSSVTSGSTVTATPTPPLLMNTTLTGRRLSALRSALAQAQASR